MKLDVNDRTRNLIVGVASSLAGRGVSLIAPLVVMRPMLHHLGPSIFGMWLTATTLAAMASFLDLGVGNAVLTRLSAAFGRDDQTAVRQILGEGYALLCAISAVLIVLIVALYSMAPLVLPQASASGEAEVVAVVLVALFLSFPAGLITRLQQARHSFIQSQFAQAAGPLAALLACLAAIRADANPVVVVALYSLSNTTVLALWTLLHFQFNPTDRPIIRSLHWKSMRGLLALGGAFFLLSIFSLCGMNADNIIIAAKAGAKTVTEYGVPAKLGSILMLIVGTVFMPLWPLFGDALARHDRAWLLKTTRRMSLGGAGAVLLIGLALTALADPIMKAWMGRSFADQHLILAGWTFTASVIALTAPYNMVLNAAGLARPQIVPWVGFLLASGSAKILLIHANTAWYFPWITAFSYITFISPRMIFLSIHEIR